MPTDFSNQGQLLFTLSKALFSGQYGDKMFPFTTQVNPNFTGQVTYHGYENVSSRVIMDQDFSPVLDWTSSSEPARKILSRALVGIREKRRLAGNRLILNLLPEEFGHPGIFKTYIVSNA